jgi:L-gulonate 3-dehydrogenase
MTSKAVALVGSGLIGRGWSMLFANAGWDVRYFDEDPTAADRALPAIETNLEALQAAGMIDDAGAVRARIRFCATLAEAVDGVSYVQESVFENTEVKRSVFRAVSAITGPDVIIASSCSGIPPEDFMEGARHPERCIIAHPFSPPHLIPLVEIVVTRWTSSEVTARTRAIMVSLGRKAVTVHKPVPGFVVNRLQAAVIQEALALVEDGVIDPEDLDACMSQGLGLRWAFIGPFETMDLNAPKGFKNYVDKFGDWYRWILDDMDTKRPWAKAAVERVEAWRRAAYPGEADVTRRRLWRDENLMKLGKLFRGTKLGGDQ